MRAGQPYPREVSTRAALMHLVRRLQLIQQSDWSRRAAIPRIYAELGSVIADGERAVRQASTPTQAPAQAAAPISRDERAAQMQAEHDAERMTSEGRPAVEPQCM